MPSRGYSSDPACSGSQEEAGATPQPAPEGGDERPPLVRILNSQFKGSNVNIAVDKSYIKANQHAPSPPPPPPPPPSPPIIVQNFPVLPDAKEEAVAIENAEEHKTEGTEEQRKEGTDEPIAEVPLGEPVAEARAGEVPIAEEEQTGEPAREMAAEPAVEAVTGATEGAAVGAEGAATEGTHITQAVGAEVAATEGRPSEETAPQRTSIEGAFIAGGDAEAAPGETPVAPADMAAIFGEHPMPSPLSSEQAPPPEPLSVDMPPMPPPSVSEPSADVEEAHVEGQGSGEASGSAVGEEAGDEADEEAEEEPPAQQGEPPKKKKKKGKKGGGGIFKKLAKKLKKNGKR